MRGSLSAEINEMAHELVEFGKRCADAGRDWLSDRRNEMNRDPQGRAGRGQYSEQGAWRRTGRDEEQQRRYGESQGAGREREYAGQQGMEEGNYRPMPRHGAESYRSQWLDDDELAERYGPPRSGYEMGYGGPGGYGPQSQSQFTSPRDFGRGYGGDDYRQGAYAGTYGRSEPYRSQSRGMPAWEGDRSMQGEGQAQRSHGNYQGQGIQGQGTQGQGRYYYGSSYGSSSQVGEQLHGFRGRGPKNYTRSDERIREDLCERLSDADEIDASDIMVTVSQSVVTLEGEVPHRSMKHWAEDMAESCSGVRDVDNRLRVRGQESRQAPSTSEQRTSGQMPGQSYGQSQSQRTASSHDDDKDTSRH